MRTEEKKTVLVIGAGAAGLMAAAAAAEEGAAVTVLESMKKPGRKLLLTGNGRCNLTNLDTGLISAYHSDSGGDAQEVIASVIRQFGAEETLAFFEKAGLHSTDRGGYVYPRSGQAQSVLSVLLAEMTRLGVKLKLDAKVDSIFYDRKNRVWKARTGSWDYQGSRIILCAGAKAHPETGSDGSGFSLAQQAGHTIKPVRPALTGLLAAKEELPFLKKADGARTAARVKLCVGAGGREILAEDTGEIQWTSYGLSGIVVFQLSRSFPAERGEAVIEADLVPDLAEADVAEALGRTVRHFGGRISAQALLEGYTNGRAAAFLAERAGYGRRTDVPAAELAHLLKCVRIRVCGTRSFDSAQVCAGGVPLTEVRPVTLESLKAPGLFLAGEILDADGPCGGYNLQWAWASGHAAGKGASRDGSYPEG